ncbi:polynucleotide 5 -hydroxyl-kinase NOL9 [Chlorella sorokiniana]|uniref:Polynucleotide 5-hydroxyl-kinase NOL9 n=1 Tax=Chlorella sorokiniana TaxID=3076 RepID=A0A2P6TXC1_CHLSO|nr:polynucleotide 5 -hydroxyl-kinase NOL9 [Chlorella sorokiniana]|eukprot:PRW58709.1 polynucleotide 5 -hydroxyl-kinase NOL9 [Chlorella sorokiniana]
MAPKKKRKSAPPADEQPAKRPGSQQGRRSLGGGSSGGGGGGAGGNSPALAWAAGGVTVTLPSNKALVFLGTAVLEVQGGEVTALGVTLSPSSGAVELAADERCGGALLLEPGQPEGAVPLAATGGTVLRITRAAGVSDRSSGGPPATPLAAGEAGAAAAGGSRQQLGFEVWLSSDPTAPPVPPQLPPLWHQAAGEVQHTLAAAAAAQGGAGAGQAGQPPVIVVCGAKKVGKSTFARFLLNSLLARHGCVAYLDTDCGQPEFTAPGLVSLNLVTAPVLGPPHMHLRRPAAAFFVGDVSPANDPARYLQYVRELYRWYCRHGGAAAAEAAGSSGSGSGSQQQQQQQQQQLQLPPLVVNTHGWVKGMGYDVLVELLQGLPVSHMIQIAASNPKKNLPPGSFWLAPPEGPQQAQQAQQEPLHWLLPGLGGDQQAQPAASETSARSAATLGGTASDAGGGGGGGRGRLNAVEQRALQWEALARQCVANSGVARQAAAAAGASGGGAAAADLGDLLAAAVPFDVGADDVEVQVLHSSVPASQLFYALNGAVAELESVSVLQLGRLELPASLLQTGAHMCPYLALFSLSSTGTGAGAIKSRGNLLRISQLHQRGSSCDQRRPLVGTPTPAHRSAAAMAQGCGMLAFLIGSLACAVLAATAAAAESTGTPAGYTAWCWGRGDSGELGNGQRQNSSVPVPVAGNHSFVALNANQEVTCGVDSSGRGWCWGDGEDGYLANGEFDTYDRWESLVLGRGMARALG